MLRLRNIRQIHLLSASPSKLLKRILALSILIFSLAFWLWRLPFILWLPIPEFSPDTFDYFSIVKALIDKAGFAYPFDLPLCFPVIAFLTSLASSKVATIIWIQLLIKFLSGLTFIYACYKYNKRLAVLTSIALSIYVTDSWSLRYDTALVPDSLYNSFLIFSLSFLILSIKSPTWFSLLLLSVSMFMVAFTRSNGLFIYFLVPILMIFLLRVEQRTRKYFCLVVPAFILHLSVVYLKSYSGILQPGNERLIAVITRETGSLKTAGPAYFKKKLNQVKKYFFMEEFPSFYFSLLPERYRQVYELDIIHDPDYKMYDWTTPIPDDLRKLVYREYACEPEVLKNHQYMMDVAYAYSSPIFLLIHVSYKIQNTLFRNILWYVLGLLVLIFSCWRYVKNSFADKDAFLVALLCIMHFLNILVVTYGHDRFIPRYAHMTEFLLYLAPVFLLMLILHPQRKGTDAQ